MVGAVDGWGGRLCRSEGREGRGRWLATQSVRGGRVWGEGRGRRRRPYLLVGVVVGVDVVVELLVLLVLFVTQLAVEVGPQVLQSFGDGLLLLSEILNTR